MSDNLFIQILREHMNCQRSVLPGSIDLQNLIDTSKKQNLEGIVYSQTKIKELQTYYAASVYSFTNRKHALAKLEKAFQQEGVEYFLVKGFAIAAVYPHPELRTMGDCDIVVHTEDKEKVHKIMMGVGARFYGQAGHEWQYRLKNMEFEIHDHLMYEDDRNPAKAIEFFDKAWNYAHYNSLDWEFHFIFLLYHLRKHILGNGAGIRQFMDLAVVIKNIELDWDRIIKDVQYLEIEEFFNRVMMVIKNWFDIKAPGIDLVENEDFIDLITEKIIKDGVFGFSDPSNRNNMVLMQVIKNGNIVIFKRFLNVVFLPYKDMIGIPEYEFLRGKPYLLPFAWFYRACLKWKKRGKIKEIYMISSNQVDGRMEYLKQWGL